ncbi:MAG: glycosyltransferase family 9 protein [Elusimicrobia bacterium]|nr:glycosyltransferase family 9 protein [Elusimicrobiota bacterium]
MNILIIKLAAKGDVLRTTGILPALKDKYPGSNLYWLVNESGREVLEGLTMIDRIFVYKKGRDKKYAAKFRKMKLDLVISLEESENAAGIASGLGAEKVGFILENGKVRPTPAAQSYWMMSSLGPAPQNDVLKKNNRKTYQQLLKEMLSLDTEPGRPLLNIGDKDMRFASRFLPGDRQNTVGLSFGSGNRWPTKRLALDRAAEFVKIMNKDGNKVVIFAGEDESREVDILKKEFPGILCAYRLPIRRMAAVMRGCSAVVTTDSFPLHVALAAGTRVLALFGPTSAAEIDIFGLGKKLVSPVECTCCYRKACDKVPFCMDKFSAEALMGHIKELPPVKAGNG